VVIVVPKLSPDAILEQLDPEQRDVASCLRGPLVVLAGAVTGKTRAITHRIAYGVRTGEYQPASVLAVTFTARAAGEMRGRLRELGAPGVQAKTFHAAALKQLTYFWPKAIGGPMWNLIEYKGRYLAQAASHIGIKVDAVAIRDLASEVEWAKVSMIDPAAYVYKAAAVGREPPTGYTAEQVAALALAYEDIKQAQQLIDFEDILTILGALLAENTSIADQVRRQYRHFVVDEYQDVSPVQQFLLDQWLGGRDDLCVVGDPSQTIYSFTGARPTYLLQFLKKFPRAQEIRLVRDYRSTPQIVTLANDVLKEGKVEGALVLKSQRPPGVEPKYRTYDDDEQEAIGVAENIEKLIAQGILASDIAILYRTNAQSAAFENALSEKNIGYQVKGGEQFFTRPDVRRALTLLEAAAQHGTGAQPSEPTSLSLQARAILEPAGWSHTPPASSGATRERWEAMSALVGLADELTQKSAAGHPATVADLIAELRERAAHQNAPTINGVTLASLHAAKGLEWRAVFLAGMSEGLMPISLADTPEAVAEERRLLYVGITRAQELLEISFSKSKTGGRGNRKPTRFLAHRFPQKIAANANTAVNKKTSSKIARAELSEDDAALFEHLRTWRSQVATAAGKPAFTVLADTTLLALATTRPANSEALGRIPGIGPIKLEQYGAQLLTLITDFHSSP